MKKILILAMSLLAVFSCSENEKPEIEIEKPLAKIPINLSTSMWTKVTDAAYEQNDQVGLYVVNQTGGQQQSLLNSGNHVDNAKFTFDSQKWNPEKEIFWKDQTTKADFYCYYPYTASINDVASVPVAVKLDQSTLENYKASEFLWGKKLAESPSPDPVKILTNHLMSNLIIVLKPGKGYNEESFSKTTKSIKIIGMKHQANFNLADGKITAGNAVGEIIPMEENGRYKALVVPQEVNNAPLISVKINNDSYQLVQTVKFEPNRQYTCTLVINRIGEGVDIGIGGWEQDGNDYGGTLE